MAATNPPRTRRSARKQLPDIRFELRDGTLYSSLSERPAFTTATQFVASTPLAPPERRPPTSVYMHPDFTPADERSEYWLLRDACDYLTVLTGRLHADPMPPSGAASIPTDPSEYQRWFDQHNPSELPLLPRLDADEELRAELRKGKDTKELWDAYAVRHSIRERLHRDPLDMPPSDWRGFVERRVAFLVGRSGRDPLVSGMVAAICKPGRWEEHLDDARFEVFRARYHGDETFRRRLHVLLWFVRRRATHAEWLEVIRKPRPKTLRCARKRVEFVFPPDKSTRRDAAEATRLLLLVSYVALHQRALRTLLPAQCAAVTFEARHYLVAPKALASDDLTQSDAASHFGVSRRQVQVALAEIRTPDYTDRIFNLAYRRRIHGPQVKRHQ